MTCPYSDDLDEADCCSCSESCEYKDDQEFNQRCLDGDEKYKAEREREI